MPITAITGASCKGVGGIGAAERIGKACVPDNLPFVTDSMGLLGTRPSWEMMQASDALLMVGTSPTPNFCLRPDRPVRCRLMWHAASV